MSKIAPSLFEQMARASVPLLRRTISELGLDADQGASVSAAMTADIEIDGRTERVRVEITLNPEEDDNDKEPAP